MDWLNRLNAALDYIENNLDGNIIYEEVAKAACFSEYHFSRMFSAFVGIPMSEYIRRRRLTKAAFDIQTKNEKIIDVALKYGYDSPDAFSRAFKSLHNVSPNNIRANNVSLKAYPRISFKITTTGDTEMEYRIEDIDFEFRLAGRRHPVKTSQGFNIVPVLWDNAIKDGYVQKLIDMAWVDPKCQLFSLVGVCGKEAAITDEAFDYFMGVRYDREIPDGMEELVIPPSLYAVFPNTVEAWKRLYSEWLPTSGYELANLPCIEHFLAPGGKIKDELWVPVIAKK